MKTKTINMIDLGLDTRQIIKDLAKGLRYTFTYRGESIAYLTPITSIQKIPKNDPFYSIADIAEPAGKTLTNKEIDAILYK